MFISSSRLSLFSVALAAAIAGCNSSGGGGSSAPPVLGFHGTSTAATIDSNNSDALALAATEALDFGVTSNSNPMAFAPKGKARISLLKSVVENSKQKATDLSAQPSFAGQTIAGDCGGSVTVTNTDVSGSMVYNNYCMDFDFGITGIPDPLYISGAMSFSDDGVIYRESFTNVTVTYQGETFTFSGGYEYDSATMTLIGEYNDFQGNDGNVYRVEDASISGDATYGYTGSARIYHSEYGYVDINTTSPIMFECAPDWQPSAGAVTVTDSNGNTVEIVYNSCVDATVTTTINGSAVATTYTW